MKIINVFLAFYMSINVAVAFADGDSREATPAEKAFAERVLTVFEQSVPSGPQGWTEVERTDIASPERVTTGQETYPMRVEFHIHWQDDQRITAFNNQVNEKLPALAEAMTPDKNEQKRQHRYEALAEKMGKAIEQNNMAEAMKLQKEMERLAATINAAAEKKNAAFDAQIRSMEPEDVKLKVYLTANEFHEGFMAVPAGQSLMEGFPLVRVDNQGHTGTGWHEGSSYVFLGNWRYVSDDNYTAMEADQVSGQPHTRVQTITVRVEGEKQRAQTFLSRIDWKALNALLGN